MDRLPSRRDPEQKNRREQTRPRRAAHAKRRQFNLVVGFADARQQPAGKLRLTDVVLNQTPVLRDEQMLPQRREATVSLKLSAAIVRLGRRREDLDDHDRIEQRVFGVVFKQRIAGDTDIGVRPQPVRTPDTHVAHVNFA